MVLFQINWYYFNVVSFDDIEALDVVATYVGADKQEKFWLFMATEKLEKLLLWKMEGINWREGINAK